jgi:hypothetical protein
MKYNRLTNWYVQRSAGAIFQPVETPLEMLHVFSLLRETCKDAQCGLMRQTLVRATGQVVEMEIFPIDEDGAITGRMTKQDREGLAEFLASYARVARVISHRDVPITNGSEA